ncbi:MAG: ribonuclease R, partial [Eubacteriales bacterium]|nr:ribonuclease R [Eubacteriales bacterium]
PMKINDIMLFMEVPINDKDLFLEIINNLIKSGKLVLTPKGKLMTPEALNMIYGTYVSTAKGFGFVMIEGDNEYAQNDIFISEKYANGAMHKDKVLCQVISHKGKRAEGTIIKVIEKGYNLIIGTFQESRNFGFVVPDEKRIYKDIFIPKKYTKGAVSGHKVVVKIIKEAEEDKKPEGKIIEILGHINDPGIDILSVIKQFELPIDFEDEVYEEIENIPSEVLEKEKVGRTDLRNIQTVTIDGEDAKDLDDAITIEKLENGNFKLGVHIADVTHYVKQGTPLDREALKRGTSVYLVDRVIPMLPHKLSNGICSLNAQVDRLALSCIMEINNKGEVISHEILETIINVDKRMSYTIVNDILTNEDSQYKADNKEFLEMFKNMEELRNILLNKRIKRGSIEFDFAEAKIILDKETRKPLDIKIYDRNVATSIIEEFMLIANETVAEHYFWLELPFVYRTHEEPDLEKIEKMAEFIGKFGYSIKGSNIHSKAFQKILTKSKNTPEDMLINRVVLRSFKQARYSTKNEGHFGLAAKYYCHFTSPIRRYPDLQIHRIIKENLNGKLTENRKKSLEKKLPDVAKKCSARERTAEDAERETVQIKKVEYMQDKVGQIFEGIISGVTSWGIYVELPNTVEGMISVKNIEDDYYFYDEKNMQYFGEKTGKVYSLGDRVKVKLIKANLYEKTLDFQFINEEFE